MKLVVVNCSLFHAFIFYFLLHFNVILYIDFNVLPFSLKL